MLEYPAELFFAAECLVWTSPLYSRQQRYVAFHINCDISKYVISSII